MTKAHLDRRLIQKAAKEIQGDVPLTFVASGLKTDPHKISPGEIFAPVVTKDYDGHAFIEAAIENGASASFWNEQIPLPNTLESGFPLFITDDIAASVKQMAEDYLFDLDPVKAAVTGDYTRDVTKTMLKYAVEPMYTIHESEDMDGNEFTYAEAVLSMLPGTDILLFNIPAKSSEAVRKAGKLSDPSLAIVSIFRVDEGQEEAENALLIEEGMKASGTTIIDGDAARLVKDAKTDLITYGFNEEDLFRITNVREEEQAAVFEILGVRMLDYKLPLLLSQHVKFASAVVGAGLHLGVGAERIQAGLEKITAAELDFESFASVHGSVLLFDGEQGSESGLAYSLGMLRHMHRFERRALIVDEGFQSNPLNSKFIHEVVADEIRFPITDVITVGEKAFWIRDALNKSGCERAGGHYATHHEAMNELESLLRSNALILYRGANKALLKQIIKELNSR
ncbi:hypothetical protein [Salisediminibacterium halotolerans]|uniref:UDP-N-acetylmuramoyl-tripeptide--D-alanyl-D-alanine ligase n=1 Tax=Salisediminibacterium halotolerans TaxID=517425 RepID=A0A1H9PUS7_9BACI|nr:hypothetical protein [Salisediminibacterium haloalkalitolerans]SER51922.1 UDP-N-acetylmuramoyl-tripeptide--D-alanyl-D-alanine ligase [Salisediminibacterium haloalkalitolerans]